MALRLNHVHVDPLPSASTGVDSTLTELATAFRLIERKVLTILKRFNEKIRPIISDLNTAAQDDTLQDVHKGLTSLKDTICEFCGFWWCC